MTPKTELQRLEKAIWDLHKAHAAHRESVPVREVHGGLVVWDGVVEVFDLLDHPKAKMAYAWAHEADSGGRRFVAVLGLGPVDSPRTAVQAATVQEYRERQK
jgi:hypothetical protein